MKKIIISEELFLKLKDDWNTIIDQELLKVKNELLKRLMSKIDTGQGKQILND